MSQEDSGFRERPVRVAFPARVEFAGETFQIQEFTANLSVGGIFLPTDHTVPPLTRGTLTFRISQWEEPFTVQAEVVRSFSPGEATYGHRSGLGILFVELSEADRERLERLVAGVRDGSVVEAIRRSIQAAGGNLLHELRQRPVDQKLMLALQARDEEIRALIRDGNPVVLVRLLDNPRFKPPHVRALLRDPRGTATILLEIEKRGEWMKDEEVRYLFCRHPRAPLERVEAWLPQLPPARLRQLAQDATVRPALRQKIQNILRRASG